MGYTIFRHTHITLNIYTYILDPRTHLPICVVFSSLFFTSQLILFLPTERPSAINPEQSGTQFAAPELIVKVLWPQSNLVNKETCYTVLVVVLVWAPLHVNDHGCHPSRPRIPQLGKGDCPRTQGLAPCPSKGTCVHWKKGVEQTNKRMVQ